MARTLGCVACASGRAARIGSGEGLGGARAAAWVARARARSGNAEGRAVCAGSVYKRGVAREGVGGEARGRAVPKGKRESGDGGAPDGEAGIFLF